MQVCIVEIDAVALVGGATKTFYLSDIGYCSLPGDPSGPICYLPFLDEPLQCDRELPISPESARMVGATWGDITLFNQRDPVTGNGYWDGIVPAYGVAGRGVRVKIGNKTFDQARGIWLDPSISTFTTIFSGVALDWVATADAVNVRIRDNLAFLENPLQTSFYGGTGGADGNDQIAGQPIPKLRGKVKNITPTFVDTVNLIYQISDAKLNGVTCYDGGAVLTAGADYANYAALVAATVASGTYATCMASGLIRLGTSPAFALTVDSSGYFPSGTLTFTPAYIVENILTGDAGYGGAVDTSAFSAMSAAYPYDSGLYTGATVYSGIGYMTPFLASIGASIGTLINGEVEIFQIAPPTGTAVFAFGPQQILDCQIYDLDASVIVPNWRRTLSYAPNDTVLTTLAGVVGVNSAERQFLTNPYAKVTWANTANKTTWPTSADAPIVQSRLQNKADAQAIVNLLGALWGQQRYLFDVTLPLPIALAAGVDLGQVGTIQYPDGILAQNVKVLVVGHNIDVKANTVVLRVLV